MWERDRTAFGTTGLLPKPRSRFNELGAERVRFFESKSLFNRYGDEFYFQGQFDLNGEGPKSYNIVMYNHGPLWSVSRTSSPKQPEDILPIEIREAGRDLARQLVITLPRIERYGTSRTKEWLEEVWFSNETRSLDDYLLQTMSRRVEPAATEHQAKASLQNFLDLHRPLIAAMRSSEQILDGRFRISLEQREELWQFIDGYKERLGRAMVMVWNSHLCKIWDDSSAFWHANYEGSRFDFTYDSPGAVRGFRFLTMIGGIDFNCLVLDGGKSREYFDTKDESDQAAFMKRYALNDREYVRDYNQFPLKYVAVISDTIDGYKVDKIV